MTLPGHQVPGEFVVPGEFAAPGELHLVKKAGAPRGAAGGLLLNQADSFPKLRNVPRVNIVFALLYLLLLLYFLTLLLRMVFDWIQVFARDWRPKGMALVTASFIYRLTDPPLRKLRAMIPPLRIGSVALDLGFLLLIVAVGIGMSLTKSFAA